LDGTQLVVIQEDLQALCHTLSVCDSSS
jgi:hypothetical protein